MNTAVVEECCVVRLKAGCDTIKPECVASGLASGLSQYLSMYFTPSLVTV